MVDIPWQQSRHSPNMAELVALARNLGITATAHMNEAELFEAVRQQQETNAVLRTEGESVNTVDVPRQITGG